MGAAISACMLCSILGVDFVDFLKATFRLPEGDVVPTHRPVSTFVLLVDFLGSRKAI